MTDATPDPAELRFEEAIAELERIIASIDAGEIGLEEAMVAHRRGRTLVSRCREVLDAVSKELESASDSASEDPD